MLRKKNINSTEKLMERIMNTNLDNIVSEDNQSLEINVSDQELKTNSVSRRNKKNSIKEEPNLLQIPKKNTRR